MWTQTHQQFYPNLRAEPIWRRWADINRWPQWHEGLESCQIHGPFETGHYFMLKPKGRSAVKIKLVDVQKGRSFTDCTQFFGAKMFDIHTMEEKNGGLLISNKVIVTGPLQWLWIKLVAKKVANSIPCKMDALAALATKENYHD